MLFSELYVYTEDIDWQLFGSSIFKHTQQWITDVCNRPVLLSGEYTYVSTGSTYSLWIWQWSWSFGLFSLFQDQMRTTNIQSTCHLQTCFRNLAAFTTTSERPCFLNITALITTSERTCFLTVLALTTTSEWPSVAVTNQETEQVLNVMTIAWWSNIKMPRMLVTSPSKLPIDTEHGTRSCWISIMVCKRHEKGSAFWFAWRSFFIQQWLAVAFPI